MRKLNFAAAVFGILAMSGCSLNKMIQLSKEQQLTVNPSPLELHGDSVSYEMSANLPVKMLQKGKVYSMKNSYKYGSSEMETGQIEFAADEFPNSGTQQPRISKEFSFAYDPAMKQGDLMIQGVASDPRNGKSKSTEQLKVAEGVITTSQLVKDVYYAAYADHGYNNQEELIPTKVEFFFEQGRSVLRTSEKRSDRGKYFSAFVAEKNVTRTVTITGTHSPEGPERINSKLAVDRAAAIEKYYRQQMKSYDYMGMSDSIKFVLKDVVENWTQFKQMLSKYDGISADQKSEITNIVNGSGTFEDKEDQLQKLSSYKTIFKDIYPDLRTAKTTILTVKVKKPDAEIAVLAKQVGEGTVSADTLSDEELSFGATLTPALKEKEAIYKAAVKKSDSWAANNNLGAVYLEMAAQSGDKSGMNKYVEMAVTQLEISQKKQESAPVLINLGVAYAMQGNSRKALGAFSKASDIGLGNHVKGLNSVRGAHQIKVAKYTNAVKSTSAGDDSSENLFNKGLAQLLNKDYQNASTSFDQAVEKDANDALAYYGAAVASARLKNQTGVVDNLKKAVEKDPALKAMAVEDLEFASYAGNTAFQDAIK